MLGENVDDGENKSEMENIRNKSSSNRSTSRCQDKSLLRKTNRRSFSSFVCLRETNQTNIYSSLQNLSSQPSQQHLRTNPSEQSIRIIQEKDFLRTNLNSTTTQIELTLPLLTSTTAAATTTHRKKYLSKSPQGEFTLPTNPPITVTIQSQNNHFNPSNESFIDKETSFHDDQLYSPEHLRLRNEQRSSLDPSLKGTSAIVNYFMDLLKPSDNKLAMKLFGSKKGVLKERMRQQRSGHCIIHPCSNFRFYWDLIMLILLITNVIVLPVAIAFFSEEINSARWIIFNVISDAFFLFDIVVNFRTGVLRNDYIDEIILEPRLIAMHYIKTWFMVDLLSSLPIDYLFLFFDSGDHSGGYSIARTGRAIKVLRLVKLLSLLRLLRLSRLVRYIHQWEEVRLFSLDYFRLISFLVSINSKYGHENFKFISINNSVGSLEWLFTIYDSNVSKFSNRLLGFIEWFTECSLG